MFIIKGRNAGCHTQNVKNYLNISAFFFYVHIFDSKLHLGICCTLKTFNQCVNLGYMGNLEWLFLYSYGYMPVIIHSEPFLSKKKKSWLEECIFKDFSCLL